MADEADEVENMEKEAAWILEEEVHSVLEELNCILMECSRRFPLKLSSNEDNLVKPDKFILSNANGTQNVKCMITLMGDTVCEADLCVRVQKNSHTIHRASIRPDAPWKLQQIQDAGNHLSHAISYVNMRDKDYQYKSGEEVTLLLDKIMKCLNTGRTCLVLPKKKSIEDIVNNRNMQCFSPPLPNHVSVSFYVHAQKLELAVYQLQSNPQLQKVDIIGRHQVECQVPWLNDVIVLFTLALQTCQQLKDKLAVIKSHCKGAAEKIPH